jgi:hypothetical protein
MFAAAKDPLLPQAASPPIPLFGKPISLTTKSGVRYQGNLYAAVFLTHVSFIIIISSRISMSALS